MLNITLNIQDPESPGEVTSDAKVSGPFFVEIRFEDDGKEHTPVRFDSVALEILYNDGPFIIGSDVMARPLAGEVAKQSALDLFSRVPVQGGSVSDQNGPYANASLLTLRPRTEDRIGPFRTTTGLASFGLEESFLLSPDMGAVVAMSGRLYPAAGAISGRTSIVAVGQIFHRSQPVPYHAVVGSVELLPMPGVSAGGMRYPDSYGH